VGLKGPSIRLNQRRELGIRLLTDLKGTKEGRLEVKLETGTPTKWAKQAVKAQARLKWSSWAYGKGWVWKPQVRLIRTSVAC